MEKVEMISELVQTVRKLNWEVRPKVDNTPGGNPPGNQLHRVLGEIRDNEVATSLLIREMSLADSASQAVEFNRAQHEPVDKVGSRQLLSEFGTARESILSLIRTISNEDWTRAHETPGGSKSMEQVIDELIASDRQFVNKISSAAS